MNDIVEKITQEVMSKLKSETLIKTTPIATCSHQTDEKIRKCGNRKVILITANFKVLDKVLANIKSFGKSGSLILISEYLYNTLKMPPRVEGCDIGTVHSCSPQDALKTAKELIIPSLSLNTLSKAANLIADSYATQIISFALTDGIPIIVTDESIIEPHKFFPAGVAEKINRLRQELENMGVTFCKENVVISDNQSCGVCQDSRDCPNCFSAAALKSEKLSTECLKEECPRAYGSCSSSCEASVRKIIEAGAQRIDKGPESSIPAKDLARYIDHTLLKPTATAAEITKLCEEALQYNFASVCVNPAHVALAAKLLRGSPVKVCTVVGFPLGATSTFTKVMETRDCIANGATEIDMVINVGALKAKDYEYVKNDIARVVEAAQGYTTKVIIETSLLTREEKIKACELAKLAGADFVKTSTGFSTGGATVEDVALMRSVVGPSMGVKASGGIRDAETAKKMVAAGATRIGASASVAIIKGEASAASKGY